MTLINRIATTAKGWTDNVTCYEWFTKTFIPQAAARRENPEETIILVLDGHASHKTPEMFRAALENNIEFHFLPPHTTHQLQPLDVGVFGSLQRKWQERCDEIISKTNMEVPRSQFVKEYMGIRNKVFTPELIQSAWKKAGAWPLNPKKFTEKDFAPSKLMSYAAALPPGYPEPHEIPDMLEPVDEVTHNGMDKEEMGGNEDNLCNSEGDRADDEMAWEETCDEEDSGTAGDLSGERIVRETGTPNNAGHLSRYEKESHCSEQLMFTYPNSSASPNVLPTFVTSHERSRIAELEEEVVSLRSKLETANSQLETAAAHSVCAGWEIKSLKERLNTKNNAKKHKVQVHAQYISSAEATQMLNEQACEEAEKRQREEEAQATKKAKDDQRKQQREAGGIAFSGSLNNKTKDDLLDITFALQLTGPGSNATETRAELISLINNHLDKNPHLASDSAFAGLFLSRTRGRRRNDENAASSSIPPPTLLPPNLRQPLSSDLTGNASDSKLESELSMVLFNELPQSGRFFQSITSMPPDFSLPGPSSFAPYTYPPPVPHPTDPQFPPPFYLPPSPHG